MENKMMVSIVCNTYNHEKYIADALEGFVSQKTSFPIEILVMDDASTDGTADIIREYEKKYPEIIKPIYHTVNQFSQGLRPGHQNMVRVKGKYIAVCEGDDYWIDKYKLQKQVDFLENNSNYAMCLHCVESHAILKNNGENFDVGYIPKSLKKNMPIKPYDIITSRLWFQTSSFVFRAGLFLNIPSCFVPQKGQGGDWMWLMMAAMNGGVYYMTDVMSVYNKGVEGSWTLRLQKNKELAIKNGLLNIESLKKIRHCYPKYWLAFTVSIYKQKCRLTYAWGYPTKNLLVKAVCFLFKIWNKMMR